MAESPTQQPPSQPSPIHDSHQLVEYWCHQCRQTVTGQTLDNNQVVCSQCNDGFLVSVSPTPTHSDMLHHIMQTLELLDQMAPPSQPSDRLHEDDQRRGVPVHMRRIRQLYRERIQSSGIGHVGNYGDYADEAEYQSILLNLAESDDGGNRGAPPAAESAVAALKNIKIESENEAVVCVVCKDSVSVGETAKELPCGHGYHGECIVTWLATRNMCPVCRYELPTSDPDYEEERIKKISGAAGNCLPDHD